MIRVILYSFLGLSLIVAPALSQDNPNEEFFCSLNAADFLSAMEGNWTVTQGPGLARAGAMDVPLPPQRPVTLNLEFLPEIGVAFLSGQGEQMFVFPMLAGSTSNWTDIMPNADVEEYSETSSGCGWSSLRSLVASNTYVLEGGMKTSSDYNVVRNNLLQDPDAEISSCFQGYLISRRVDYDVLGGAPCTQIAVPPGHMKMTIVARFSSPFSGSGHVYFSGKKGPSRFSANAPLTWSR